MQLAHPEVAQPKLRVKNEQAFCSEKLGGGLK